MGSLNIGHKTYGGTNIVRRGNMNTINVGKYCSIATGVVIDGGFNHDTEFISTYPFNTFIGKGEPNVLCKGDVNIGSDVWIGEDVLIMSGITIGDGAVIAARSVVTKNVLPYQIVGGVPAKNIRFRFAELEIKMLLELRWWDWSDEKVIENAHLLSSKNIVKFLEENYL
jgi:acetyltransferase-like isoleucine patch superfamily enzyme